MALPKTVKSKIRRRAGEPNWLAELRRQAGERFAILDRPVLKYGLGVSFDAGSVAWPYDLKAPAANWTDPSVSGETALVLTLEQALADKAVAAELRRQAGRIFAAEDKLWAWHAATCDRTLVIRVPQGLHPARPVRIDRILSGAAQTDRLIILAGPDSSVTVVDRIISAPGRDQAVSGHAAAVDVFAGDGACVDHVRVQNLNDRAASFSRQRAWAGAGACVRWMNCCFGGDFTSVSTSTSLVEAGARTEIKDLYFGRGRQRLDLRQEAVHLAAVGCSDLSTRGALTDEAKAICRGLIRIERGAGRCQGRQKTDTLLLNERAEAASLPFLEIGDDDVSCGHASAIGRLDQEKLFYLMSRGLDRPTAMRQLVEAFLSPMIAEMKKAGLEDMVACLIGRNFRTDRPVRHKCL